MTEAAQIDRFLADHRIVSRQVLVVSLCAAILVLDGLDVQTLAFAAPSILAEWRISPAILSPAVAASLIGMTVGSAAGGRLGDAYGRRAVILVCAYSFGLITVCTSAVNDVTALAALRLLAGIGFGAAVPNAMALAAEWMPERARHQAVAILSVGVPLGGMMGALGASILIARFGWRGCFVASGVTTLLLAVALSLLLPESPAFAAARSSRWAILLIEKAFGPASLVLDGDDHLDVRGRSVRSIDLFRPNHLRSTLCLMSAYFFSLFGCYAMTSWLPTALHVGGLTLVQSIRGAFVYNMTSIFGAIISGTLMTRAGSGTTIGSSIVICLASAISLACYLTFELAAPGAAMYSIIAVLGFSMAVIQSALYALANATYPASIRANGLGVAMAAGRTGGILAILLAGNLLTLRFYPAAIFVTVVIASTIGVAIAMALFDRHLRRTSRGGPDGTSGV